MPCESSKILALWMLCLVGSMLSVPAPAAAQQFAPPKKLGPNDALRPDPSTFDVTPSGEAVWAMPIWAPVGRHGIEPHLSIIYRSRSGNGLLGLRFGIGGLSAISRCWGSPAQDGHTTTGGTPGLPDQFCLDGQRLVQRAVPSSGELQPEFDPSISVQVIGPAAQPDHFIVRFPDGRIETFGARDSDQTHPSRALASGNPVMATPPTGTSPSTESIGPTAYTLVWNVDRISDRWGNYMDVDYARTVDTGIGGAVEVVPSEIRWTGYEPATGSQTSAAPSRRIQFVYQDAPKLDSRTRYIAGVAIKGSRLLQAIRVLALDGLTTDLNPNPKLVFRRGHIKTERVFREYRFSYLPSSPSFRTADRLRSIQKCSFDTATSYQCSAPVTFGWEESPAVPTFAAGETGSTPSIDFPIIDTNQSLAPSSHHIVGFAYDVFDAVVGDFDGDGKSDILYRLPARNPDGTVKNIGVKNNGVDWDNPVAQGDWYLRLGTPNGLGPRIAVPGLPSSVGGDWIYTPRVVDINGDGKDELILFGGAASTQVYGLSACNQTHCDFVALSELSTLATDLGFYAYEGAISRTFPTQIADFNGDGIPDVVSAGPFFGQLDTTVGHIELAKGSAPNGSLPYGSFGSSQVAFVPTSTLGAGQGIATRAGDERYAIDMYGNGQYELLTPTYNSDPKPAALSMVAFPWSPSAGAKLMTTTLTAGNHGARYIADLNGDGLSDVLELTPSAAYINSGSAFRSPIPISLSSAGQPPADVQMNNPKVHRGDQSVTVDPDLRTYDQGVRLSDLDGDGRTDALLMYSPDGQIRWLRSTDDGFQEIPLGVPSVTSFRYTWGDLAPYTDNGGYGPRLAQIGDFNGDGLLDIALPSSTNLTVYLQKPYVPDLVTSISGGELLPHRTIEYDHTGAADATRYTPGQCNWPQLCLKSIGWVVSATAVESADFSHTTPTRRVTEYQYEDARLDRLGRGLIGVRKVTATTRDGTSQADATVRTTLFDLDSKICQDPNQNQCAYSNAALPVRQTTTVPVLAGNVWRIVDTEMRQSMAFQAVGYRTTQVVQTNVETERRSVKTWPGLPPRLLDTNLSATRSTRAFDGFGNVVTSRSELSKDVLPLDGSVAPGQNVYTLVLQADPTQIADTANWLISRYTEYQRISIDPTLPADQQTLTQTINLTYEPQSIEVHSITSEPYPSQPESETVSGFTLTTIISRDERGTPVSVSRSGSGSQRLTSITFDPNDRDHIFPSSITNGLNQTSRIVSNAATGLVAAVDDPNGIRTSYNYDAAGRLTQIVPTASAPISITYRNLSHGMAWSKNDLLQSLRSWSVCKTSAIFDHKCEVYDPTGRVITRSAQGFNTEVRSTYEYDARGGLVTTSAPFDVARGPEAYGRYQRDGLERVTRIEVPGDTPQSPPYVSTFDYIASQITATSERGIQTVSDFDEKGRLIRRSTVDPRTKRQVTTSQQYWHFDQPLMISHPLLPPSEAMNPDPGQLVTSMTYDTLGRLESVTDPDVGTVTKRYNAFGELKRLGDANGCVTTFSYDDLSRPSTIDTLATDLCPSRQNNAWAQHTQFVYDTALNGIGRLANISSNDNIQNTFAYDPAGRLSVSTWTLPVNTGPLSFNYDYNVNGQLQFLTYPLLSGLFRLKYDYAGNGKIDLIADVSDPNHPRQLWQQLTRSAADRSTEEQFGVTEHVSRGYDAAGRSKSISGTFIANGSSFQQLAYSWTGDGLPRYRVDTTGSPLNESFTHDFLGRLVNWVVGQNSRMTFWQFDYDDLGNMRSRETFVPTHLHNIPASSFEMYPSSEFSYTLPEHFMHPHAVKSVTTNGRSLIYNYDASGRMISGGGNTYTWTPFGLPWLIVNRDGASQTFSYDGMGERVVNDLQSAQGAPLSHTVTPGGFIEIETNGTSQLTPKIVYNVVANNRVVAQVVRNGPSAGDSIRFIHPDLLGSPDAITTESVGANGQLQGSLVKRGKYEPFGERRSPSSIAAPVIEPDDADAGVGFTGQEPDEVVGLVNMRGRLYDPQLTQFISPDPLLDAGSSQGLNRYSYVRHSPVAFTDPTGFQQEFSQPVVPSPEPNPDEWLPYVPPPPLVQYTPLPSSWTPPAFDWSSYDATMTSLGQLGSQLFGTAASASGLAAENPASAPTTSPGSILQWAPYPGLDPGLARDFAQFIHQKAASVLGSVARPLDALGLGRGVQVGISGYGCLVLCLGWMDLHWGWYQGVGQSGLEGQFFWSMGGSYITVFGPAPSPADRGRFTAGDPYDNVIGMAPAIGLGASFGLDASAFVTGAPTFSDYSGWSQNLSVGVDRVGLGLSKNLDDQVTFSAGPSWGEGLLPAGIIWGNYSYTSPFR